MFCRLVIFIFWGPHGLQPTRLLCPWDSPAKNTGLGCHLLLQGNFADQRLYPHLLHRQAGSLLLRNQGSPSANSGCRSKVPQTRWPKQRFMLSVLEARSSRLVGQLGDALLAKALSPARCWPSSACVLTWQGGRRELETHTERERVHRRLSF